MSTRRRLGTTGSGPSVRIHGNISSLTRLFPQRLYKHLLRVRVQGGFGVGVERGGEGLRIAGATGADTPPMHGVAASVSHDRRRPLLPLPSRPGRLPRAAAGRASGGASSEAVCHEGGGGRTTEHATPSAHLRRGAARQHNLQTEWQNELVTRVRSQYHDKRSRTYTNHTNT